MTLTISSVPRGAPVLTCWRGASARTGGTEGSTTRKLSEMLDLRFCIWNSLRPHCTWNLISCRRNCVRASIGSSQRHASARSSIRATCFMLVIRASASDTMLKRRAVHRVWNTPRRVTHIGLEDRMKATGWQPFTGRSRHTSRSRKMCTEPTKQTRPWPACRTSWRTAELVSRGMDRSGAVTVGVAPMPRKGQSSDRDKELRQEMQKTGGGLAL